MTRPRLLLAIGLVLLLLGATLIGYLFWPLPQGRLSEPAPATLFVSPP